MSIFFSLIIPQLNKTQTNPNQFLYEIVYRCLYQFLYAILHKVTIEIVVMAVLLHSVICSRNYRQFFFLFHFFCLFYQKSNPKLTIFLLLSFSLMIKQNSFSFNWGSSSLWFRYSLKIMFCRWDVDQVVGLRWRWDIKKVNCRWKRLVPMVRWRLRLKKLNWSLARESMFTTYWV